MFKTKYTKTFKKHLCILAKDRSRKELANQFNIPYPTVNWIIRTNNAEQKREKQRKKEPIFSFKNTFQNKQEFINFLALKQN
jgi:hypothetical protein